MKRLICSTYLALLCTQFVIAQSDSIYYKKGYQLLFNEEFSPTVPITKYWFLRSNVKMGGTSLPKNIIKEKALDGSNNDCVLIKFTYDSLAPKDRQYEGGGIVSKSNFGYGYYEAKVKLYGGKPEFAGLHQSFWSMGLTGTNEAEGKGVRDEMVKKDLVPQENRVLEIDGFEMDSKSDYLAQNYHIYSPTHLSMPPKLHGLNKDLSGWITFAYEWLPDRINYYCNNELFSTQVLNGKWQLFSPQNFWLTALPVNVAAWGGLKKPLPNAAMQIDYFKFYAKKLPGVNRVGNSDFEYKVLDGDPTYPVGWIVKQTNGDEPAAVKVLTAAIKAKSGTRFLSFGTEKAFSAKVKQLIEYIPNGNYRFEAWVKGSVSGVGSIKVISGAMVKSIKIPKSNDWVKLSFDNVVISNNNAIIEISAKGAAGSLIQIDRVVLAER